MRVLGTTSRAVGHTVYEAVTAASEKAHTENTMTKGSDATLLAELTEAERRLAHVKLTGGSILLDTPRPRHRLTEEEKRTIQFCQDSVDGLEAEVLKRIDKRKNWRLHWWGDIRWWWHNLWEDHTDVLVGAILVIVVILGLWLFTSAGGGGNIDEYPRAHPFGG